MAALGNSEEVHTTGTNKKSSPQSPVDCVQLEKEDLAPDGGWGWMVAVGMIVVNLVTMGQSTAFGLVYGDFLDASGSGGSALTSVNLTFMVSLSASGLICSNLLKRYSIKPVGVIGALIYATSNTVMSFVPNVPIMLIMVLVQGIGVGLIITVCNVSFNGYFVKRRTKVMGFTQVIVGLGGIGYPFLAEKLLSIYGFRGCVALLGALSFNGVVSMYVMDPVEQHYKTPKYITQKTSMNEDQDMRSECDSPNFAVGCEAVDPIRRHSLELPKGWQKNRSVRSLIMKGEAEHEKPLLIEALKAFHRSQDHNGSGYEIETGFRTRPEKGSSLDTLANKLSIAVSMCSLNGITGFSPIVEIAGKDVDKKKKSMGSILADFFEISLLRDGVFVSICIGSSLTFLCDALFNGLLPMLMTSQGYAKPDIALTLMVVAITELVAKLFFAVFAIFVKTKARHNYLFSLYCLVACRIAFLYCNTLTGILIVHGLSGAARSLIMVHHMLILAEHVKIERFAAAWGLFTVINGCTAVIFCPLIGFVKDLTGSYVIAQYVLLGGLMLCLVSWTIEIFISKILTKNKTTTETVNQK